MKPQNALGWLVVASPVFTFYVDNTQYTSPARWNNAPLIYHKPLLY